MTDIRWEFYPLVADDQTASGGARGHPSTLLAALCARTATL